MMEEMRERGRFNYLNEDTGYFFSELDGVTRWREGGPGWWNYYPNPISKMAPDEDTYEYKMAWSLIRFVASILVQTQARIVIEQYWKMIQEAPANEEMKAQILAELQELLKSTS